MSILIIICMLIFNVNRRIDAQVFGNVYARQDDIAVVTCNVNYPSSERLEWFELEQSANPNPPPVYTSVNNPGHTTKNPDKYEMVLGPRYDLAINVNRPENQHYCVVKDASGNEVSRPNTWNIWVADGPNCQDQIVQVSVNNVARLVCRQGSHGSSFPMEWYTAAGNVLESTKEYHYETKHQYLTLTHEFVANIGHHNMVFGCTLHSKETGPNDLATFTYATCSTRIEII
ncbi:unnamed protein product [Owenia fusiformis]|uniref:Ig-like domain-containing protein n=1 Tax=Owenia fusiformis TaxID=6347 RepID=A0A8S4PH14_OWEFU|nr:unnamed protein product [Owenia fusiformis]